MLKPDSLRAALAAAIPALAQDPDKVAIFIDKGRIAMRVGEVPGFEYRYTLNIVLQDFPAGEPDRVMIPVCLWLLASQPELVLNHQDGNEAITFEADIIDDKTMDLSIEIALTEAVTFTPRQGGGYDVTHVPEPVIDGMFDGVPPGTTIGEAWLDGELVYTAPAH